MNRQRRFLWFRTSRPPKYNRWTTFAALILIYRLLVAYWQIPVDLIRYYEINQRIADTESRNPNDANAPTCRIPKLDPYDPSIRKYISKPDPLRCKQVQWDLTYLDEKGVLVLNETAMKLSGYSDLECTARCFDHNTGVDDDSILYGEWVLFEKTLSMGCQMVEVNCVRKYLRVTVYAYHFMNISRPSKPLLYDPHSSSSSPDSLSVVVLSIDSMSKSNMIRQMPSTYSYIVQNMSGIVFDGHTKIGDNTWVNMLAMFTGLRSVSTADFKADLSPVEEQFFDDYAPYLWRNFSRAGYYTLYSEDRPDIHSFNYGVRKGFLRRPFDYYDRPYWTASWASFVRKRSTGFCYDTVPEHQIQLDYLRRFIVEHHQEKSFGVSWWQALTHDFLNTVGFADADTTKFLHSIRPYLNRTVLFILSDHGHRYDSIRQSVIGRLEARLPFMSIMVPEWFQSRFPNAMQNLHLNARQRLTTQFDVYGTLVDILENNLDSPKSPSSAPPYALSLFRSIPPGRSCLEARIPEEYCPCYSEVELPQNEPMVQRAADVLVTKINRLLESNQPPCAFLKLSDVVQSSAFLPHRATIRDPQVANRMAANGFYISYRVVVRTSPGDALLEGTVKHFVDTGSVSMDSDVERNNAYKNTSYCVQDSILKKYCYCLDQNP